MRDYILLFIFIFAAIVSYNNKVFALTLLVLTSCTFGFITELTNIQLGGGSVSINDFIILSIFIWTILNIKLKNGDTLYLIIVFLIFWICLSSILAFIANQITIREVYRSFFKISLYWILPISFRSLNFVKKKKIISYIIVLASIISIIQVYAIIFADIRVLSVIYANSDAIYSGLNSMGKYFLGIYHQGEVPRIYSPGQLLIKIIFGFLLSLILFKNKDYKLKYILPVLFLTGLFNITLGGRSDILHMLFVILLSFFISFLLNKNKKSEGLIYVKNIYIISFLMILLFITLSNVLPKNITLMENKWSNIYSDINKSPRNDDTIEAWDYLIRSPLWGIGRTKVYWAPQYGLYGGQDVHPIISQGLLCGFIGIILLLFLIYLIVKEIFKKIRNGRRTEYQMNTFYLSAGVGILGAIMLSIINTTPVFFYAPVQVPLGIFMGLLFSKQKQVAR